jgi:hypothetical protein
MMPMAEEFYGSGEPLVERYGRLPACKFKGAFNMSALTGFFSRSCRQRANKGSTAPTNQGVDSLDNRGNTG